MHRILATLLLLISGSAWAGSAHVDGVRLWSGPERTRAVFDISDPVDHKVFSLSDPERLVIDLSNVRLESEAPAAEGVIRKIRSAPRNDSDLRVVFDLEQEVRPKSFVLEPNEEYGHRLVVDLYPEGGNRQEAVKRLDFSDREARPVVVAIDAGHGGEDPGAIGRHGTREKEVVLAVSERLAGLVNDEPGMKAFLVRRGDYYLSLRERIKLAREQKADLFISVHADAFRNQYAKGASVYALSERGATDETAQWLAQRENASDLIGGVRLSDKDDLVASVLMDLSQTATIGASLEVGEEVLDHMGQHTRLHKSEVLQAGFAVLKSPDIPSILIETAFISNPAEEKRLNSAAYQRKLAASILSGARSYFRDNPVPGTTLARIDRRRSEEMRRHVIADGDTLSEIAREYRVSLPRLRAVNDLKGDRIKVGDVLSIPVTSGS